MNPMYSHTCRAEPASSDSGPLGLRGRLGGVLLAAGLGLLLLSGCDLQVEQSGMEEIRRRGVLMVLTRNAPTTYFEKQDQQMGFEYDLAVAFANHLGVAPQFLIYNNTPDLLDALLRRQGDLVAAGFTITPELQKRFRFGPSYMEVEQEVICRRGGKRPRSVERLNRVKLLVGRGSSQELRLRQLRQEIPHLRWTSVSDISSEEALEMVWRKEVDCTVADSNVVAYNRRYFPELVSQFTLEDRQSMAWILPKRAESLQRELGRWFRNFQARGEFDRIYDRYFGHVEPEGGFDFMENRVLLERIEERLPLFRSHFELAEKKYGLSWRMLAAVAYQESHWDVTATSPTGVKGIMMLTVDTAKHIGVRNRLDPRESILGGAWYLAELMRTLPADIQEPDRTWIALAAYNVGMGHVLDARELARDFGYNPSEWSSLRKMLPLLSHRKFYETLKHGYARGSEPVQFVRNVRRYMDILESMDAVIPMRSVRLRPLEEGEGILDEGMDSDDLYDPSLDGRFEDDGMGDLILGAGGGEEGKLTLGRMFGDVLEELDESGNVESAVHYLMDLLHLERAPEAKSAARKNNGASEGTASAPPPVVPPMPNSKGGEESGMPEGGRTTAPAPAVPPLPMSSGGTPGGGITLTGEPLKTGSTTTVSWAVYAAGATPGSGVVVVVNPAPPALTPAGGAKEEVAPVTEEVKEKPLPEPAPLKIIPGGASQASPGGGVKALEP